MQSRECISFLASKIREGFHTKELAKLLDSREY